MKIRTKLAATALAAGTLIGGGAAFSMTAAQAKPVVGQPSDTVVALPKLPNICQRFPDLCVRPLPPVVVDPTTPTPPPKDTTKPTVTQPKDTTKPTVTTKPTTPDPVVVFVDPPVHGSPAFTG